MYKEREMCVYIYIYTIYIHSIYIYIERERDMRIYMFKTGKPPATYRPH